MFPGLSALRRELLTSARAFYEEFLRRKGNDPGLRFGLAAAQLRVAQIGAELDGPRAAEAAYRQALASYEALAREHPDDATVKAGLADCLRGLALARPDETSPRSLLERAQQIQAELARARPEASDIQLALARVEIDLAEELRRTDFPREALGWYQRARDIEQELVRNRPDDHECIFTLGDTLGRMAQILDQFSSPAEASALRREAIEYVRAARESAPGILGYGQLLGNLLASEAGTQRVLKNSSGAVAALEQAAAVRQAVARENPDVRGAQTELIASFQALLDALKSSGRSADIEKTLGQVRAFSDGLNQASDENYYRLAVMLAGGLPSLRRGEVATGSADESRRYGDAAINAMRKAVAVGFRDLDRLKSDKVLAALRSDDGFQSLITQLERARAEESLNALASDSSDEWPTGPEPALAPGVASGPGTTSRTARDLQEKILTVREETARLQPNDQGREAELARSRFALGVSRMRLGNQSQGFSLLNLARTMQEELVRAHPQEVQFRLDLSSTLLAVASAHVWHGRHNGAQRACRRAIEVLEQADRTAVKDRGSDLTRALAEAHLQAGRGYSRPGLWREAVTEFAMAFQLAEPDDPDHWLHYATLLLVVGDKETYRHVANRMIERFDRSADADQWSSRVATTIALGPGAADDPARLLAVAERGFKADSKNLWNVLALAMAELRAGRHEAVVDRLEGRRKDERTMTSFARTPMVWPVLAMAYGRLGRRDEALRWLDRADSHFDQAVQNDQSGTSGGIGGRTSWNSWAAFLVVRREASLAIRGGLPSEDARERLAAGVRRGAMGLNETARTDLEAVVADRGQRDLPQAWIELGRVLAQAGQGELSDAAFARAADSSPEEPQRFLERGWWIAGPLPTVRELDPAADTDPARPIAPANTGGEPLAWTPTRTGYEGWINFKSAYPVDTSLDGAALTWLYVPNDRDVMLAVDALSKARVWLNGQLVHDGEGQPGPTEIERIAVPIRLSKGRNSLLARVSMKRSQSFYLRVFARSADVDAPPGTSTFLIAALEPDYFAWLEGMRKAGYRPTWVHIVDGDGPVRFAALAVRNPEGLAWECRIDRGPKAWETLWNELYIKKRLRIASASCSLKSGELVVASIGNIAQYLSPGNSFLWFGCSDKGLNERIGNETGIFARKPVAIVGYPDQGSIRYAVFGVPLDAAYHWLSPELELEPLWKAKEERMALGYRPVSVISRPDSDRRRFAMVLWRDDPATSATGLTVSPRSFAFVNARMEAQGFRPQFLTPLTSKKLYHVGWTRQELPSGGAAVPALAGLETALTDFMRERGIRGATLAVAKDGRIVLSRSFGWSDRNATKPVAPGDPMRLASLSKQFTAAAIQKLIGEGKLAPDGKVVALLDIKPPQGKTMDPRWEKVTIQNLIDHRGGWRRADGGDPMLDSPQIATKPRRPFPPSARDIVDYMAGRPLDFEPGTERAYTNFGYCLLGRVIEQVTGRPYVDSIRALVLEPLNIKGVEAARSLPKDRHRLEPEYVHPGLANDLFSTEPEAKTRHPDGGLSMEALDSAGGLIAPAADVARFFSQHGGHDGRSNPPGDERRIYTGELPGTYTMALRLPGNLVIVVLCNQSVSVSGAPMDALSGLMERAAATIKSWPAAELDRW